MKLKTSHDRVAFIYANNTIAIIRNISFGIKSTRSVFDPIYFDKKFALFQSESIIRNCCWHRNYSKAITLDRITEQVFVVVGELRSVKGFASVCRLQLKENQRGVRAWKPSGNDFLGGACKFELGNLKNSCQLGSVCDLQHDHKITTFLAALFLNCQVCQSAV